MSVLGIKDKILNQAASLNQSSGAHKANLWSDSIKSAIIERRTGVSDVTNRPEVTSNAAKLMKNFSAEIAKHQPYLV